MIFRQWNAPSLSQTKKLYDVLRNIVSNDEQMTKEYFGMNSMFVSSSVQQESSANQIQSRPNEIDGAFKEFMELF